MTGKGMATTDLEAEWRRYCNAWIGLMLPMCWPVVVCEAMLSAPRADAVTAGNVVDFTVWRARHRLQG